MSRPYFTDAEWEELLKKIKPQTLAKEQIVNAAVEMMKGGYRSNQQATANHTAKMFNHSRTQHLAWGGNPATLGLILPKDYILINDYPIHAGYRHNKDGYVWMYNGNGWLRQEKIKMTRKEAKQKLQMVGSVEADKALDMLEALELIKFDKEIGPLDNIQRSKLFEFYYPPTDEIKDGYLTSNACKALIDALDKQGYKIVKK